MFWQSATPCIFVLTTAKQRKVYWMSNKLWFSWGCEHTGTTVQRRGHIWPAAHPYFLLPPTCRLRWVTHLTYCTCSSLPHSPHLHLRGHLIYHPSLPPSPTLLQTPEKGTSNLLLSAHPYRLLPPISGSKWGDIFYSLSLPPSPWTSRPEWRGTYNLLPILLHPSPTPAPKWEGYLTYCSSLPPSPTNLQTQVRGKSDLLLISTSSFPHPPSNQSEWDMWPTAHPYLLLQPTSRLKWGGIWPTAHSYLILPPTSRPKWGGHLTYCSSLLPPSPTLLQTPLKGTSNLLLFPIYCKNKITKGRMYTNQNEQSVLWPDTKDYWRMPKRSAFSWWRYWVIRNRGLIYTQSISL